MSWTGLPQPTPRARSPLVAAAIAAALVLCLGSSCGSDDETIGGTTTTERSTTSVRGTSSSGATTSPTTSTDSSTSVPTTDPAADPAHQEIIDAYVAYWDARFAANSGIPNPQDPALARYATGRQLEAVIAETQENLDAGRALQPSPDPVNFRRVTVVSVDGDSAVVQECFIDDGQVIESATGRVLNDTVATHSVQADLLRVDGQWRVSAATLIQRWEGVAGCALATS